MWHQATPLFPHGSSYVRDVVTQRRHPDRKHRQNDGAHVYIQHADLCAGDGQKDLGRHGQADPKATSGVSVIPGQLFQREAVDLFPFIE